MKLPETIQVCGEDYKIKLNPASTGGEFDTLKRVIVIGSYDKLKIPAILIHELLELVFATRNLRYSKEVLNPDNGDYLFSFNHEEFNQAAEDFCHTIKGIKF